jgi:single-strand DNA-binding protein
MPSKPRTTKATPTTENTSTNKPSRGTSVNRVILVGRLVADPDCEPPPRVSASPPSGSPPTTASSPSSTTSSSGGSTPGSPAEYMTKGRLAYIEGRQQARTWEAADGSKRRTVEVVAETFKALTPDRLTPRHSDNGPLGAVVPGGPDRAPRRAGLLARGRAMIMAPMARFISSSETPPRWQATRSAGERFNASVVRMPETPCGDG